MEIKNPLALSSGSILMTSPYNTDTVLIAEKKQKATNKHPGLNRDFRRKTKKGVIPPEKKPTKVKSFGS